MIGLTPGLPLQNLVIQKDHLAMTKLTCMTPAGCMPALQCQHMSSSCLQQHDWRSGQLVYKCSYMRLPAEMLAALLDMQYLRIKAYSAKMWEQACEAAPRLFIIAPW